MATAVADSSQEYEKIDIHTSVNLEGYKHAAHCMIWAPFDSRDRTTSSSTQSNGNSYFKYHNAAAIGMQMRFDGQFGFPGGMVDESFEGLTEDERIECVLQALNRELLEEINLDNRIHTVYEDSYLFSHKYEKGKIMLHFYALQMTYDEFCSVEREALRSIDFGEEVLGICRVPMYTMGNGHAGLPAFLENSFVGNAKEQLIKAIEALKIMGKEEIDLAVSASNAQAN